MSIYREDLKNLTKGIRKLGTKIPSSIKAMSELIAQNETDGILTGKTKELIAIGIAINTRCDSCLLLHIANALKNGASPDEIYETIGVSIVSGGGAAIVMGIKGMKMVEELTEEQRLIKTAR